MQNNLDRFSADLEKLVLLGRSFVSDMHATATGAKAPPEIAGIFERKYHSWYSEAVAVVRQLLPARLEEFVSLYETDNRRKVVNLQTFSIQDWLLGFRAGTNHLHEKLFDDAAVVAARVSNQVQILAGCKTRLKSSLFELKQVVQADLFDTEVEAARALAKRGHLRAAGALLGVVIERHLGLVAANHQVKVAKKEPTIADLNDALKAAEVYDTIQWRKIQGLGDLRNLCSHNKSKEPTKDDVEELATGAEKLLKSIA